MFKEIINKLKNKKQQQPSPACSVPLVDKKQFDISLSNDNGIFKMEISDYISINDYIERIKKIDNFGIESLISSSVLWNSKKQKVNKGTYYLITINNRLYNILINDNFLIIDERTQKNQMTEERIIRLENDSYWCTIFYHDIAGNTFYTRYYNTCGFSLGNLDLTKEEAIVEFSPVIDNIKNIVGIENIIDIEILNQNNNHKSL